MYLQHLPSRLLN